MFREGLRRAKGRRAKRGKGKRQKRGKVKRQVKTEVSVRELEWVS